ncbi:glycosyltransferase [Larkinella rosea]|uniref:Glycosyltransferase n=1 Tax=Larkinella rosea TaxID=2025312 RepID=A0A3P1BT80_9BACT|nr:glycosyltransferase [Larkinella rosea]RRB04222.1 glycosyltransferase [Larkinella rosea]
MKILLIHTYYQLRGGEDVIFEQECELLKQNNEVEVVAFYNKNGWRGALQFFVSIWNISAAARVRNAIKQFRPDVVQVQNSHFACGPIVIHTVKKMGIPIILTLHNYRLLCPSVTLLYNGELFTDSLKSAFPWQAVKNKVYRDSAILTFWLAFIVWFHKKIGTWYMVDRYIAALTDFSKPLFTESSLKLPVEKIIMKPNFVVKPQTIDTERGDSFLFIGRLMKEKGITFLLETFKQTSYKLVIAGDGPLKNEVLQAADTNPNIFYIGNLKKEEVIEEMKKCSALIFPSIWFEGMPMTIVEAFSLETPVIASNLGAMSSMIQHGFNGLHFEPGSSTALLSQLNYWSSLSESKQETFRKNALKTYKKDHTPQHNLKQLLTIYQSLIEQKPALIEQD